MNRFLVGKFGEYSGRGPKLDRNCNCLAISSGDK